MRRSLTLHRRARSAANLVAKETTAAHAQEEDENAAKYRAPRPPKSQTEKTVSPAPACTWQFRIVTGPKTVAIYNVLRAHVDGPKSPRTEGKAHRLISR